MQQHEIHDFIVNYFTTNDCELLENGNGYLVVQLTPELDKELMNRPFYWHYLEKTGGVPNPMKLTLITDQKQAPSHIKGEAVHFGSPRLHQIFQSTKARAAYIRLYENVEHTSGNIPLQPWLAINVKMSYKCDRKKDTLFSIGLNLINGMMMNDFHDRLLSLDLTPKIPDFCFTLSPLIKPQSGLLRMEQVIKQFADNDDHTWANEAKERMAADIALLDHFYEGLEELPESYELEKAAITELYEPSINIEMINGGLFYLTQHALER